MAGMSRTAPGDRGGSISHDGRTDPATEGFMAHRNLLFTVAYEMLGSAADAEDVLQETWLRWAGVDLETVHDQRAYLVRITTRLALSRLRALGRGAPQPRGQPDRRAVQPGDPAQQPRRARTAQRIAQHRSKPAGICQFEALADCPRRGAVPAASVSDQEEHRQRRGG